MATMKRRVIYLTDEQWADLQAQARGERTTISNIIRHGMALIPATDPPRESAVEFHAPRPERYDVRPIRPVPKTRK